MFQQLNNHYYRKEILSYECTFDGPGMLDLKQRCVNTTEIKLLGKRNVQGITGQHQQCMSMLLSNLAEPDWIYIPCHQPFLHFILCVKKFISKITNSKIEEDNTKIKTCQIFQILAYENCYSFVPHTLQQTIMNSCEKNFGRIVSTINLNSVLAILNAIMPSKYIPTIYFKHKKNTFYKAMVSWKAYKIKFVYENITKENVNSNNLCKFKRQMKGLQMLLYECKEAGYILYNYVCDSHIDCPNDDSDEANCILRNQFDLTQMLNYKNLLETKCPPLYQISKDNFCRQFIDGIDLDSKNTNKNKQNGKEWITEQYFK